MDIVKEAQWVFDTEIAALQATKASLGEDFETIVRLVVNCTGKVIITGMGKPGHIGTKIAASLASLGTPSFFMHPGEAMHGDLGMVAESDVVILMSYSGESDEIVRLLPTLHEIHCTTVAITGNPKSTLAMGCQHRFCFPHFEEACYMHLAPPAAPRRFWCWGMPLRWWPLSCATTQKATLRCITPLVRWGKSCW